jgi:enterochelin esterase family protein
MARQATEAAASSIARAARRRAATVRRSRLVVVILSLGLAVSGCSGAGTPVPQGGPTHLASPPPTAAQTPAVTGPIAVATFDDLREVLRQIAAAPTAAAQARADELWDALVDEPGVPAVFGDDVVFAYRGEAETVEWRGSFNRWSSPGLAGSRIGETDLWIGYLDLPAASRIEYKIVVDGQRWLTDPANPATAYSGLTGANNVLALPGFTVTDESGERSGVTPGVLQGGLSLASRHLGYPVDYWVYTPAGYEELDQLPVLVVLDGNDFVDERMGALPRVLDNMIADGRIRPLIAVFTDAREPGEPRRNRREDEFLVHPVEHAAFIADELVPAIDGAYRTNPDPDARGIAGASYGGLAATFVVASHPDVFHNLAAFSPSLWVVDSPEHVADEQQRAGAMRMRPVLDTVTSCGGDAGTPCVLIRVFLGAGIPDWDVGDLSSLARVLERQGLALAFHEAREGHTWDQWRGLSDEMLAWLFGAG